MTSAILSLIAIALGIAALISAGVFGMGANSLPIEQLSRSLQRKEVFVFLLTLFFFVASILLFMLAGWQ